MIQRTVIDLVTVFILYRNRPCHFAYIKRDTANQGDAHGKKSPICNHSRSPFLLNLNLNVSICDPYVR